MPWSDSLWSLPAEIEAFTVSFMNAKKIQWTAFWKRLQQDHAPVSFNEVATAVNKFLSPIIVAISPANQIREPGPHPAHGTELVDSALGGLKY